MKLATKNREAGKKLGQIRREGLIPAVLYSKTQKALSISVKADEFKAQLRGKQQGFLPTAIFELHGEDKNRRALIKEVQYHPTSYEVQHIDFEVIDDSHPVTVKVPVQLTGVADCAGVKLGGFIRQVLRTIEVRCLPPHLPKEFVIDVKDLDVGQSKTVADLSLSSHLRPVVKDLNQVVVTIGKKAGAAAS